MKTACTTFLGLLALFAGSCSAFLPEDWGKSGWPCLEDGDCWDDHICSFDHCIEYIPCTASNDHCQEMLGPGSFCDLDWEECLSPVAEMFGMNCDPGLLDEYGYSPECLLAGYPSCVEYANSSGGRCTYDCWGPEDCGPDPASLRCVLDRDMRGMAACVDPAWLPDDIGVRCDPEIPEFGCPGQGLTCTHFVSLEGTACTHDCSTVLCPEDLDCDLPFEQAMHPFCGHPTWFGFMQPCSAHSDCEQNSTYSSCHPNGDYCTATCLSSECPFGLVCIGDYCSVG